MQFADVAGIIKPDSDSHYLLKNCHCGSDDVVYLSRRACGGNVVTWQVKCLHCNAHTKSTHIRHDAQIAWNTRQHIIFDKEVKTWAKAR